MFLLYCISCFLAGFALTFHCYLLGAVFAAIACYAMHTAIEERMKNRK